MVLLYHIMQMYETYTELALRISVEICRQLSVLIKNRLSSKIIFLLT